MLDSVRIKPATECSVATLRGAFSATQCSTIAAECGNGKTIDWGNSIRQEMVRPGRFRMAAEDLKAISIKGGELLLNATAEDMNTFRKWI